MRKISYKDYLNKVYGCWIGKGIAGTIGAPFEGRKEQFDYEYNPKSIENMLPNDDLDLQVLWLDVIEKKGIYFTTEHLAEAFYNKCPYAPGEYGTFKKNYLRGIMPPLSGTFNNDYYINGMGCPIRSEIWACISPGNSKLAVEYAEKDGIMDHGRDSVDAEMFLAAMESEAFFIDNTLELINIGLACIDKDSKISTLIKDVVRWYEEGHDWRYVRGLIINNYGHPDCTNLYQNIGIIILALLYGEKNFINTIMIALNCGFDTDCTCATVGAILGIIYGAEYLIDTYNFKDTSYVLGVNIERSSNKLYDLAIDTCRVGLTVAGELNDKVELYGYTDFEPVPTIKYQNKIDFNIDYLGEPSIGIGERKRILIKVNNNGNITFNGCYKLSFPENWMTDVKEGNLSVLPGKEEKIYINIYLPSNLERLDEINLIYVTVNNNEESYEQKFGMVGAAVWKLYGPFWDNNVEIPQIPYWESYYPYIKGNDVNDSVDITRNYHLNTSVDVDKEYMKEDEIGLEIDIDKLNPSKNGQIINIYQDKFNINDYIGFQGPCAVYMVRYLYSKEPRKLSILIGHTDAYKLWINDEIISESKEVAWWTAENKHVMEANLKMGINKIMFKIARRSTSAEYSIIFTEGGPCSNQYGDFSSINPQYTRL